MSAPERLQRVQRAFTAHIRDPDHHPAPTGIEERRMEIYRGLLYRNIEGFLRGGFPILHAMLDADAWHALVRDFMARHKCRTPYFLEISQEFIRYLQETRIARADDLPFMTELAHYEWVELALDVTDVEPDWDRIDPNGELLDGRPALSPTAWSLAYRYPVHLIGPGFQSAALPETATFLLVYRNRADEVKFMEINSVTARLLEILNAGGEPTGRQALEQLGEELQNPSSADFVAFGLGLLQQLQGVGVVLGVYRQDEPSASSHVTA